MKREEIKVARELTRVTGRMVVLFTELGEMGKTGWRGGGIIVFIGCSESFRLLFCLDLGNL